MAMRRKKSADRASAALPSAAIRGSVSGAVREGRETAKDCRVLIEQAMYFALGFLVAGLFTLMFLPAFWRRALRLSMRRLQMLAPMSMEEVVAERDLLRAEFAVRERRLEQEMDAVKAARALDLATTGRHAARIADLENGLKSAEADNRDMNQRLSEAQKVLAERTDLLSSTEMALHEMTERAERGVERLRLLETDKEALGRETEAQLTSVVAHEAKIGALHQQNADMQRALEILHEDYARASEEAARAAGFEAELRRVSAELETMRVCSQSLAAELDAARAEIKAAQERRSSESEHFESALRVARNEAREAADRLETARADNAMLQGAVEALRAERANQRRGNGARPLTTVDGGESDVAALREAIMHFGDRVIELDAGEKAAKAPVKRAL